MSDFESWYAQAALCYTEDEFERMKQKSMFVRHVLDVGERIG